MRPAGLADVATRSLLDPDWRHHLDEFLDTFHGANGDTKRQSAMVADPPQWFDHPHANAFLGAVGEHLARRWGLTIPTWVLDKGRYRTEALFVPDERPLRAYLLAASPVAFRTRLIFTGPDPLQRARFPYHRGVVKGPLNVHRRNASTGPRQRDVPLNQPAGRQSLPRQALDLADRGSTAEIAPGLRR